MIFRRFSDAWARWAPRLTHLTILLPSIAGVLGATWSLLTEEARNKRKAYKMLCNGSKPKVEYTYVRAFRSEGSKVTNEFLFGKRNFFGLIYGPTGCGKSSIVMDLCNKYPNGTLYLRVKPGDEFATVLRKGTGMKLTLTDYFLRWICPSRFTSESEVNLLCSYLQESATKFRTFYDNQPVMFIDGADVLAKYHQTLLRDLFYFARENANEGNLIVVFISSDGTVLPALSRLTSCANRCSFFGISDIDKDNSVKYLTDNGLTEAASVRIYDHVGGRIVDLQRCISIHKKGFTLANEIIEEFEHKLEAEGALRNLTILRFRNDIVQFYEKAGDGECSQDVMEEEVAKTLVLQNILRYSGGQKLTWHSRRVYNEVREFIKQ